MAPELLSGPIACYNLGVNLEQAPLLCTGASTRESLPRDGALGRWHRFWDPCSPRLDNLPGQSQQTPQSLCPTPFYTWFSSAPGKRLRLVTSSPLRPCSLPLELFSSSSGCCFLGGRAESSGAGSQI